MRYVERDRVEAPSSLSEASDAQYNRRALRDFFGNDFEQVTQSTLEQSDWALHDKEVLKALHHLFGDRCAFCESTVEGFDSYVHRFRPKAEASPVQDRGTSHLYYLWMADVWQNLYLICQECRPERREFFPVVSNKRVGLPTSDEINQFVERRDGRWPSYPLDEKPVFVDPCYDRMLWRHFEFHVSGEIHGRDRRGRDTVKHFSLNRIPLVSGRGAVFSKGIERILEFLDKPSRRSDGEFFEFDNMPFGGAWRILLRNLLAEALDKRAGEDHDARLAKLAALPDAVERFKRAVNLWSGMPEQSPTDADLIKPFLNYSGVPAEVQIKNFKSLEDLTITIPSRHGEKKHQTASLMILGENAAGKSSILEAIAIALMGRDRRRLLELRSGDYVLNPAFMGADGASRPNDGGIKLTDNSGHTRELQLSLDPNTQNTLSRGFNESSDYEVDLPLFAYGAFRKYLSAEKKFTQDKHLRSLFRPEHVISNPEKWLLRLNDADFRMVVRALRHVFSFETDFEVLERDKQAKKVFVVTHLDGQTVAIKQRTPLEIVSSGFRSVLAMLCDIMQGLMDQRINPHFESLPTAYGLVLIDEVEAHLHPSWKMSIMTGLRQALPQVTFIATSHDPLCLRGMDKNEVVVLERGGSELSKLNLPVFTQSIVDLPDNEYWTIEQLLTADFFRLRTTAAASEKRMAEIERKLAKGERDKDVEDFLQEVSYTLPIGDTEVHRLVQEAVAEYLAAQSTATVTKRNSLRDDTKSRIIRALNSAR